MKAENESTLTDEKRDKAMKGWKREKGERVKDRVSYLKLVL